MKSLEARFITISERNAFWSSFICFAEAIKYQKFKRQAINKWFRKLVDKEDYSKSDKVRILKQLEELSFSERV
jgi:hypothetical protein